jgi:hypothetical protein
MTLPITLNDLSIEYLLRAGYIYYDEHCENKNEEILIRIKNICKELIERKYNNNIVLTDFQHNEISKYLRYTLF